ncbi:hypothetical protein D3C87_325100 [compost metagenome]
MKTHLAQYHCGCKPARGWLTTLEEDRVTCGRCIREVKRRKARKESEELHKVSLDCLNWRYGMLE